MGVSVGALAIYDYFLILDDEVHQSYSLSGVQNHPKLAQDILRLAEKEKLEWVHLTRDITAFY